MYMRLKRDINNQLYIIQSLQSFVTLHSYYKIPKNYTRYITTNTYIYASDYKQNPLKTSHF